MNQTTFGRLTIVSEVEKRPTKLKSGRTIYARQMRCICECGAVKDIVLSTLISGATRSCGCLKKEVDGTHRLTHGMSKSPIYQTWAAMKRRCYNKNTVDFKDYGARGIKVCDRWLHDFEAFLSDMGEKPSKLHSIDRIDPNGDYAPENCRWADPVTQASNKRGISALEHDGQSATLMEWCRRLNLPKTTIQRYVASGMTIGEAAQKYRAKSCR